MSVTLTVEVGDAEQVFLVPVHDGEYASVGTVAESKAGCGCPAEAVP
jgi:hypothetical protein